MQYPAMGNTRQYRVSIPNLSGGLNRSVPAHLIDDNQVAESTNMWWKNGVFKTRPALKHKGFLTKAYGMEYTYGSVGHRGYVVGESKEKVYVGLLNEDGSARAHELKKTETDSDKKTNILLAAVNAASENSDSSDAIAYVDGGGVSGVYGLNTETYDWKTLTPYVPRVLMNGRASDTKTRVVNGVAFEPYNMLSNEYIATFTTGSEGYYFFLPTEGDEILSVTCKLKGRNGYTELEHKLELQKDSTDFYIDQSSGNAQGVGVAYLRTTGMFYFYELPADGVTAEPNYDVAVNVKESVENNIVVRVKRSNSSFEEGRKKILGMKISTWYGGGASGLNGGSRLFVAGNPDYPNLVHWSGLKDPLYFPENNYAYIGDDADSVTAFGKQSDMLVIFKENELFYSTYVQGEAIYSDAVTSQEVVDIEAAQAMFPVMQIHPELGCDCPNTIQLCNNRLVWLNSDGNVYGLFSSGVYNERNVRKLSLQLGEELKGKAEQLKNASATCYEEQYLLLVDDKTVYTMDYSSYGFNYYGSYSTDEKAQKAVSWNRWVFSSPLVALLRVHSVPVVVCTSSELNRIHTFSFDSVEKMDDVPNNTDDKFTSDGIIASGFKTKLFDFGHSERLKRVPSIQLQITGTVGENAFLTYHNGKYKASNADAVVFFTDNQEETAPQFIRPNAVRVRLFGIEVNSNSHIEVGDMIINYSIMGVVK